VSLAGKLDVIRVWGFFGFLIFLIFLFLFSFSLFFSILIKYFIIIFKRFKANSRVGEFAGKISVI